VLAQVASAFADHGVSIETLRQDGRGDDAFLVVVTHSASGDDVAATVATLRDIPAVRDVPTVMHVVGD
jgi:homoserine dehydrogenase